MSSDDKNKLLDVLSYDQIENSDMRELFKALYLQVIQSQVIELELRKEISKLSKKIDLIGREVAPLTTIRSKFIILRYESRTSEIVVSKTHRIDFKNTIEDDLLKIMFVMKSGKQRQTKWQTSEVAERFRNKNVDNLSTQRQVYKVANRIKNKIRGEIGIDVLHVKGKEFYWY